MNRIITLAILIGSLTLIACGTKPGKAVRYEGKDLSKAVTITRDKHTKTAQINVNMEGEWSLFEGRDAENIDYTKAIMRGEKGGEFTMNQENTEHKIYSFQTAAGDAALFAEQLLPMEGGFNFRDMGGIRNSEGRHVKWGKVFRADELGNLTDKDLAYLASIPLISIVDFRSEAEVQKMPDRIPASVKNTIHLPIIAGNVSSVGSIEDLENIENFDGVGFMKELNFQLASDSAYIEQYKKFFKTLQNPEETPVIFHCTAGKDRTGMAAALFLYACGVEKEVIMANYLESNEHLDAKYSKYLSLNPHLEAVMTVRTEYLGTAIDHIIATYGSVQKYLEDVLEVDMKLMEKLYLD